MRDRDSETGLTWFSSGLLNQRPVPPMLPEQLSLFSTRTLRAKAVRRFDVREALARLASSDGNTVVAVDIGGDKLTASYFAVRDGGIQWAGDVFSRQGNSGTGYLDALLDLRQLALHEKIPIGISFAGPTDGTRLLAGPNLPVFIREFGRAYGSDFANLFPEVEVANDAEAGIMAGALEAATRYSDVGDVIYIINGSGLGGSVLTGDTIYATEPGHVEVAGQFNVFGQRKPCGLGGAAHVCIEAVAASKAGIEDIWSQHTGEHLPGQAIAARYLDGEPLAHDLYENSARITAHAIKGMALAFRLLNDLGRLVIVGHGGIFHVPGYRERVCAILARDLGRVPQVLFTKDVSANTCLEGAAIAIAARGH